LLEIGFAEVCGRWGLSDDNQAIFPDAMTVLSLPCGMDLGGILGLGTCRNQMKLRCGVT